MLEKIDFRPKITYSQQGDREKSDNGTIDVRSVDYKLSYLNIPLASITSMWLSRMIFGRFLSKGKRDARGLRLRVNH